MFVSAHQGPLHSGASRLPLILLLAVMATVGAYGIRMRYGQLPGGTSEPAPKPPPAPLEVYQIGDFLVNVKTEGELRYLRVEIAAAMRGYEQETAGDAHAAHGGAEKKQLPSLKPDDEAAARDLIVKVLSDASFDSLRSASGRERAKRQIQQALSEMLDATQVETVMFLSFVMQ